LSRTARIMILALFGLFFALAALGLIIILFVFPFDKPGAYALGLAVGVAVSAIKVVLMEQSLNKIADMGETGAGANARAYGAAQVLVRNALTVGILIPAFLFKNIISPWGVIIGVLSIQLSALITGYALSKESAKI